MFEFPQVLKNYLESGRIPPLSDFINSSTFYSELDYQFIDYMTKVVRPCIAYGAATADLNINPGLSAATSYIRNIALYRAIA